MPYRYVCTIGVLFLLFLNTDDFPALPRPQIKILMGLGDRIPRARKRNIHSTIERRQDKRSREEYRRGSREEYREVERRVENRREEKKVS